MDFNATSTTAADGGGGTPITALHPDVIQSHILNRLDGPTLASAGCASAQMLSLCASDHLWKEICNSTWPSTGHSVVHGAISAFPSGHRSFYSDAFPSVGSNPLNSRQSNKSSDAIDVSELLSAVDIHYDGKLIYSKVLVAETRSSWFASSPLRIELFESNETVAMPLRFDGACIERAKERLTVSWILINPSTKRAINIASLNAVDARLQWLTEGIQLRFATVAAGEGGELVQLAVAVTCGGKDGGELQLREVSMQVEDMEGRTLTGSDSLVILEGAMEGQRYKSSRTTERDVYDRFVQRKVEWKARRQRKENLLDTCCVSIGVSIFFLAIWILFLRR